VVATGATVAARQPGLHPSSSPRRRRGSSAKTAALPGRDEVDPILAATKGPPELALHGSFSLTVNFDAIDTPFVIDHVTLDVGVSGPSPAPPARALLRAAHQSSGVDEVTGTAVHFHVASRI
jgi:hypothetical protein